MVRTRGNLTRRGSHDAPESSRQGAARKRPTASARRRDHYIYLILAPVQEGLLAAIIFHILHRFPDRGILGRGQRRIAFGLGRKPRPYVTFLPRFWYEPRPNIPSHN